MTLSHASAVRGYLAGHGFELPSGPALPPLDVAERDLLALGFALTGLATALGLECAVTISRSLLPHPRGMVEIRARLALLRGAVALACLELGIPERHLSPDEAAFAILFVRARHAAGQVT